MQALNTPSQHLKRNAVLVLLLGLWGSCTAQGTWDIIAPGPVLADACGECQRVLQAKPKEVQLGLYTDENNDIWFVITDAAWLDKLFTGPNDGLAVDVIPSSYYDCAKGPPANTSFHKGALLKPVYRSEIRAHTHVTPTGSAMVKAGHLPAAIVNGGPFELSLILLKDRNVCHTNSFFDLDSYRWDLLNMGLYMDTLSYGEQFDTTRHHSAAAIIKRKALHFTIPFERGKSTYSPADLRPLYHSLRLTDFTISRITIEAYSSVEGPEDRNIALQEQRAQSIVDALQSYQDPSIERSVKASENWVEFLRDVRLTSYAELALMDRTQVKARLRDKRVADHLEPILKAHRKAVVTIELRRKDAAPGLSEERVLRAFEQAVAEKNVARARELQNTVIDRIMNEELPSAFLDRLEIPMQREFSNLLNSRAAFRYFEDPRDAFSAYQSLLDLQRMLPGDAHINYNLCAVKFRVWLQGGAITVDPEVFRREIEGLRKLGIEETLVKRMLVNHAIVMAEVHMLRGEYAKKDERMNFILRNYRDLPLGERDHLSLAQYFASFANYDQSLRVLEPLLTGLDADEDLLFYYLNLTIADPMTTARKEHADIRAIALSKNKKRFCDLFLPFGKGGVTFQLLDDPVLFRTYCEHCQH